MSQNNQNSAATTNEDPNAKKPDDQINIEKEDDKFLRLFFVGLYVCAVSGLGMTLSIYYFFLWDSSMPELPKFKRH